MKLTTLIFLLLLLPALGACRKGSQANQQASSPGGIGSAPASDQSHPAGGAMTATDTKYFKGSIGSALLQMKLLRQGDQLSGSYFYQKIGTRIDLKGSVDKDGHLVLDEFGADGKQTGSFKGSWTVNADDGLVNLKGNWTRPDGQKSTPFSLQEEPISLSGAAEIVAKSIKENNKKPKYSIDIEYPQVVGALNAGFDKFNEQASALVLREVKNFKKEMADQPGADATTDDSASMESSLDIGYTIALANDDVISVQFDIGTYYQGAAHPNSSSEVINFDVRNARSLKLADLFKSGAKYLQTIASFSTKDLKRQSKAQGADGMLDDESIDRGAGPDEKNYQSWTITRKGLGITFDAYQVGPYAAGPQYVLVPYSSLKDLIEPNGVLASLSKS